MPTLKTIFKVLLGLSLLVWVITSQTCSQTFVFGNNKFVLPARYANSWLPFESISGSALREFYLEICIPTARPAYLYLVVFPGINSCENSGVLRSVVSDAQHITRVRDFSTVADEKVWRIDGSQPPNIEANGLAKFAMLPISYDQVYAGVLADGTFVVIICGTHAMSDATYGCRAHIAVPKLIIVTAYFAPMHLDRWRQFLPNLMEKILQFRQAAG